jgi:hypothetical protein
MARLGAAVHVVGFRRAITADTAVRLGRYFGNSTHFWLDFQGQYDIGVVEREKGAEIAKRVRMGPLHVAVPLAPPEGLSWTMHPGRQYTFNVGIWRSLIGRLVSVQLRFSR